MNNPYAQRAHELAAKGFTPIPLTGKKPMVEGWQNLRNVTHDQIMTWGANGYWKNIGMVCGEASNFTVVIDFDGLVAYDWFKQTFPDLVDTMTVATGSGNGIHAYYRVDLLPNSLKVMDIISPGGVNIGNIEFKSDGTQVVIPPSIHPDTQREYTVLNRAPIMHLRDLQDVIAWAQGLKPDEVREWKPPTQYTGEKNLNRKLLAALESAFMGQGHKTHGDWINCSCPNSAAHKNGDKDYSFGFNTADGGANCYRCGGMSIKQMCGYLNIDPASYGGIYERTEPQLSIQTANPNLRIPTNNASPTSPAVAGIPVVKRSDRLTNYVNRLTDFDTPRTVVPVPFPLRALHKFSGMARVIKPGKVIGIVGVSGGGKTSVLETMVDCWLGLHVPCIVWSPEWSPDEFIERAVQRYGGPRTDELYLHEIFVYEQQHGITNGAGVEMTADQLAAASKAIGTLRQFKQEVGYLDCPFMNADQLQLSIDATLKAIDFKPRVLIIDYVQLLHAMERDSNTSMYNLLMRLKAICGAYGLVGVLATQVTKDSTRGQQDGKVLDSLAARYVNDDAFNLFVTINPDRNEDGTFQQSAVLNVAKNSVGKKGRVRVAVNWERLAFSDTQHPNQVFDGEAE